LRDRGEDVVKLAESLMARLTQRHRIAPKPISVAGRRRLLAYAWPGNVRELAHELERALVFEESDELNFDQLMAAGGSGSTGSPGVGPEEWFNPAFRFREGGGFSLEDAILRLIHHALAQTGGNVSAAARLLGVSRDYLRYRLGNPKVEGAPASPPAAG
jgi:DNA-binding NtrC family response regulator